MSNSEAPASGPDPTLPPPAATATTGPVIEPQVAWNFCRFAGGFWQGPTGFKAWVLTLGLAVALVLSVGTTVALNQWNRWFFDALEKKDAATIPQAILVLLGIVAVMAAIGVTIVITRETLQVRWREWLIGRLVGHWLSGQRYYHLNVTRTEPANPEYRIADDTRWATEPLVDLGIGLVSAVFGAAAFISILWTVGGSITLPFGEGSITIPAYMVIVALVYGGFASALMLWIGRPLAGYFYGKNEAEGDFRFALMRLRDNVESVALMSGEKAERSILGIIYTRVVGQWMSIVRRHGMLTWVTNTSGPLKPIIPLLFAAPKYFSGELSLGQVTQLAAAFLEVQIAISWIVDNFNRIAEWYASARRVMDIVEACDALDTRRLGDREPQVAFEEQRSGVDVVDASVGDPFGTTLLRDVSIGARAGTSLYVSGDTSVGKTTLVRALAGLWTQGHGIVRRPDIGRIMILPQKPYVPLGTLADALAYPDLPNAQPEAEMRRVLALTGLAHLAVHLTEKGRWDQRLSNGERQRLNIARVVLHRPEVAILDDALSALDEVSQGDLIGLIRSELPEATLVSLGQTHPAQGLYDRVVTLERKGIATAATVRHPEHEKA
jgi:putative ATP-binding cassette transporter